VPANDNNNQGSPTGYIVRVFQWKTSDLSDVLQKILNVCYSSMDGKADHEKFATELTTALEWIINHCFLLRDVSSMEDAVKKQFNWDETQMSNDAEKFQTDTNRFQELEKTIAGLRFELQTLKESNRKLEDQMQNQASINTVLETQLTETELKEAYHKILELEVELESKNQYCEELDTKCVELQLQLQRYKVI
jgi:chromosome segregation ATPase